MSRAIVLIGVSKTHGSTFATLQGVEDAVTRMEQWAHGQGIEHVVRLTDATKKVTVQDIKTQIFELIEKDDSLEQLIVYFSGHGIVNALSEYWLLSGAPLDSGEAVNVTGSAALAMAGSVPHVVLISDACRTSSNSVQTGRINGSNIFPNDPNPDTQQYVDVFYATRLGAPALEVAEDRQKYVAVYTQELAEALSGNNPDIVKDGLIRPRPLKDWLKQAVPRALAAKNLAALISQSPEASISSGDKEWIARFAAQPPAAAPPPALDPMAGDEAPAPTGVPPAAVPEEPAVIRSTEAMKLLVEDALARVGQEDRQLTADILMSSTGRSLSERAEAIFKRLPERGPTSEIRNQTTGFAIFGGQLRKAMRRDGIVTTNVTAAGWTLEVEDDDSPAVEVLIEFASGKGVLLPAIRNYVGVIQLEDDDVSQIHYEPASGHDAGLARSELQFLRSTFYTASQMGELNLEPQQAADLGRRMQNAKFIDPALAIYAAYAYQSIGKLESIRHMARFLRERQGLRLFDVSLLAREFVKDAKPSDMELSSSLPILTQGWAFIDAFFHNFPEQLKPLQQHVSNTLWSQYDAAGMRLLELWMLTDDRQTAPSIIA